ncbi:tetratricopeptide repeat protein [Mariniblastus sp.]|nr:tetratricopeptide repeat protein [Mariniblastus sp.]
MLSRFSRVLLTSCFSSRRRYQTVGLLTLAVLFCLPSINSSSLELANDCLGQTQPAPQAEPDLKKAMKYHSALLRRPNPGYLYDRFYNTWLDTSSQEELKQFLIKRADAAEADPAERLLLAFFYAKQGKDVEALQQFRVALQNNPDNAATLYEMAIIEARTLDFEAALANLSKAAKASPSADEGIKIAQLRGKLLVRNRQTEEAAKVWDELTKNNPDDLGLMEDLIELQISEGMFEQAQALSDTLIEKTKDPFQKVIRTLRKGDILQRAGSQTKALEIYGNTLAQVGMDTWIEREIIGQVEQLFRREDDLTGLNDHLIKMVQANSKRVAIRKTQAKILMELGRVDDAIETFEKIIELTPGSRENREAFTNLLISADKDERAVKQMESLVAQHPKDAELQVRLANLCHKIADPKRAKAALDKFVALSGSAEYSYLRAARLFQKFDDRDSAKATYQTALEKFQDSDSVKEAWADFLFRSDAKDEAVKVWQALAKDTDRTGLVRLARLVSARKSNQVAMDMLLARYDEFKLDSIYLGQLCTEAIALKKYSEAIVWATERVRLAKTSSEVDSALPPALLIINAAKQTESVIKDLREKENRSAVETCLLVEMLERASFGDQAESELNSSFEASKAAKNNQDTQILAKQRVRLARGRQDWSAAAEAARELLDLPGGRKSPNVRQLIELYVRADDDKSALKWIAEWKRLSPGSLLPWLNEASLLDRAGESKQSIAVLRAATREFPDDPDLLGQLAQKYLRNGQLENAERIFWRQYEESENLSDRIRWAEQLAKAAQEKGEIDKLVKVFDERRKNNPQSIEPLLSIAQAHRIAGNYEERRAALLEATRLKKDDLALLLEIARLEESEGDWEKAIQTLEQASLLDKTSQAKQKIARLYLQYGETQEGLARLLELAGGENSTAPDVEKISDAIAQTENWEELSNFLAPQLVRFPNNYRLGYLSAIANEELGNTEASKNQFLELLQVNQEISATYVVKNKSAQNRLNYFAGAMPEAAIDLMGQLSEVPQYAYSYRQNSGRGSGVSAGYTGGYSAPSLNLPTDIESCHQYALSHLCEIARDLPQEAKDGLQSQLERVGVENANLLMAGLSQADIQADPLMLLEIDPENKTALAIVATSLMNGEATMPQEVCLKAYETFKESFPTLALFAAIKLDQDKPENQSRLTKALERLKTIEEPNLLLISFIAQRSYRPMAASENDPLNDHRAALNQLLLDWYPKLTKHPQMSGWAFQVVTSSFREEKTPQRLIEFLDQELARTKKQSKSQQQFSNFYGRYQSNQTQAISLPAYPPTELISFPSKVYGQLEMQGASNNSNDIFGKDSSNLGKLTADQTAVAVNSVKDPMMKVLLELKYFQQQKSRKSAKQLPDSIKAAFGAEVADAKSAIDQLFDESKTNVDAWYLAGALAVKEKRWADAANNFETMRNLPMTAEIRRKIDGHLVALASLGLAGDLKNEEFQKVVMSAKSAALRLRRGTLSQDQRVELVSVFEQFGLNDEAKKMEGRIASAANSGATSSFGAVPAVSLDRITKLKRAGKSDAAARLLMQEFQVLARQSLNLSATSVNGSTYYQLQEFNEKIEGLGLENNLLKLLDPGEAANARKLGSWALANELFGKKDIAESTYKKLLENYPQENAARSRYVMLNPKNAHQLFTQEFPNVHKRFRAQFLAEILNRMRERIITADDLLPLAESMLDYHDGDDGDSIDESSLSTLRVILASAIAINANQYNGLPSIFTKTTPKEAEPRQTSRRVKKLEELRERRRGLHDRLALELTDSKVAGQAAEAFTALLGSTEAAGKPVDDQIVKLALKTVYPQQKSRAAPINQYNPFGFSHSSPFEEDLVVKRTPVEFLARYYGLSDDANDDQVESIAKKLDSLRAKEDAAKLRNTYRLCRATDANFAEVVGDLVDAAKGNSRRRDATKWSEVMTTVFEIWKERKSKADISAYVIDYAARKQPNDYNWSSRNGIPHRYGDDLLQNFMNEFVKVSELSKIEQFMTDLRLKMLGSEEEQRELAKLLVDEKTVDKNRNKLLPLGTYYFTAQLLMKKKTLWLGVKEMQRFPFPGQDQSEFSRKLLIAMSEFKASEVDALFEWLGESKVLANLSDFDPIYRTTDQDSQASVWAAVLRGIKYQYDITIYPEIAQQLSQKSDLTFGEKLLLSFSGRKPANIYQMYGDELETFSALPNEQQIQLAKFAKEIIDASISSFGSRQVSKLPTTKESREAKRICLSLLNTAVKTEVVKLMDAERFKNLGVSAADFEDWAGNVLESMSIEEPEELLDAVIKISELDSADKEAKSYTDRQDMPFKSRLIEGVIARDVSFDSIRFLLAALEKDGLQDVNVSEKLSRSIGGFFRAQFTSTKAAIRKEDKKLPAPAVSVKALKQIIDRFSDEFGHRDLNVLIPELRFACTPNTDLEADAVNKWLHSDQETKHPEITNAFRIAFDCHRDTVTQNRREGKGKPAPQRPTKTKSYFKEILDFIDDESIPLQTRSRVAVHLVHYDALSCEGVATCGRVIAEAYDAGQAFDALQNEQVFEALAMSEGAPEIQETGIRFAKSLAQTMIKRKRSYRLHNVISAIRMIDQSGDKAQVKNLLDALQVDMGSGLATWLIELGYFAEAEKQCEKVWSGLGVFNKNNNNLYTNKLESQLPAFLNRFKEDGKRYFAEVCFASMINDDTQGEVKTQPTSRLEVLADRFASVEFQSKRERALSLMLLAKSYVKPEVIDGPLTDEVQDLSIESLLNGKSTFNGSNEGFNAKLLGSYLSTQVQLQKFEPVQAKWKEINDSLELENSSSLSRQARYALDDVAGQTSDSFYRLLQDKSPDEIAQLLPVLYDLNKPAYLVQLNPNTTQLAVLMAGQPDELSKFFEREDAYRKEKNRNPETRTSIIRKFIENLDIHFRRIKPTNPESRLNFASSAWEFGKSQNFNFGVKAFKAGELGPNHGDTKFGIEQFAKLKTYTDEELLEIGPALAEIYSVNGEIWVQTARRQAKAKQYAKAAESYRKSIEDATEAMQKAKFNRRVEYANTLVKLKRNEEAKKLIEGVDNRKLYNINRQTFKRLKQKLNKE